MENIFNHLYVQILVNILMRPRFVKDNKNFIVEISGLIFPHLAISLKIWLRITFWTLNYLWGKVFSTYGLLQVFLAEYRISTSPNLGELFLDLNSYPIFYPNYPWVIFRHSLDFLWFHFDPRGMIKSIVTILWSVWIYLMSLHLITTLFGDG